MAEKCEFIKSDGRRCGAWSQVESVHCFAHDPKLAAKRAAWRKAGGERGPIKNGDPIEARTVEEIQEQLWATLGATWELANSGERTRALVGVLALLLRTLEVGQLEERVAALEMLQRERANGKVKYPDPHAIRGRAGASGVGHAASAPHDGSGG